MDVGQRIKEGRKKANMTQKQLASELGISYVGVCQWEIGKRLPKNDTLQIMAKLFKMSVADFFDLSLEERDKICDLEEKILDIEKELQSARQRGMSQDIITNLEQMCSLEKKKLDECISSAKDRLQNEESYKKAIQPDRDTITFAQQLYGCMTDENIKTNELADKLKKEPTEITDWLSGKELPQFEELEGIARALGVSVMQLYNFTPEEAYKAVVAEQMVEDFEKDLKDAKQKELAKDIISQKEQFLSMAQKMVEDNHAYGKIAYWAEFNRRETKKLTKSIGENKELIENKGKPIEKHEKPIEIQKRNNRKKIGAFIMETLRTDTPGTTKYEQMMLLADILSTACDAASRAMAEIDRNTMPENDTQDAEAQALLEAFSKLNSVGRAEAVKHIQNMQYVPGYQKPTE